MKKRIAIIGCGISGLSAAAYAARAGFETVVFEKNSAPGGRARQFRSSNGYLFDMGPSWYWMPDIINNFFMDFGQQAGDFYDLVPLDPQFDIIFSETTLAVPRGYGGLKTMFENMEQGAGKKLDQFMQAARFKYQIGMEEFVHKPCHSWREFASLKIAAGMFRLDIFSSFRNYVGKFFKHPYLVALMEFPVIFLGASPKNIPALYSLMNYGGYVLGTWYPMGGFYQLILAMKKVAEDQGAVFYFNQQVEKINEQDKKVVSLTVNGQEHFFDGVIAAADYHHTESLLPEHSRNYSADYWKKKTFAPSCLIYYLGFTEKIPNLQHHNLFFEYDLDVHTDDIYINKKWPDQPLFYACCPSKTDPAVAPENHENVFLLMPLATGIEDTESLREKYFTKMIARMEKHTKTPRLADKIDYKRSYCVQDFITDYNAFEGNAYGLANTLSQTAVLKPSLRNKKLANLFYAGQLTVPGPGVPPCIISGKIAASEIIHYITSTTHEKIIR